MGHWLWLALTHPVTLLTIGGAAGTNARYWVAHWVAARRWTEHFPLGIVLVNVSGSLLLGVLVALLRDRWSGWYLVLGIGFCGGYTTFSTFAFETFDLLRKGHTGLALLNVVASVVLSVLAVAAAVLALERTRHG
jgi:CrcB protein